MSKVRKQKKPKQTAHAGRANAADGITGDVELELMKRLWSFAAQFRNGQDADKILRSALRLGLDFFGATEGCVVSIPPGRDEPQLLFLEPRDSRWETDFLVGFLRGHKIDIPPNVMLARIRRHGRMWGAMALRSSNDEYHWDARQAFSSIGAMAGQLAEDIDVERVRQVRARIDQKLFEQERPKNLFYEILHSIRSLAGYDHSAALLICDAEGANLEIVAEQIAWRKAKSQNVGRKLPLTDEIQAALVRDTIVGFDRLDHRWHSSNGADETLAGLLDYNAADPDDPSCVVEHSLLCAPLSSKDKLLGLLKVAAVRHGTFGTYESDLIAQFLPQVSLALQGLHRTQSLEMQILEAERKHAMADLARGVSHDINNALGSVLPLVQQLREDAQHGELDPALLSEDLKEIERSLQVCRRIFGGMLGFARSMARNPSDVFLHHEVECTLAILKDGLKRRGIKVKVDVPTSLAPVRAVQADIEQLLLNLIGNARDAMEAGDLLTIRARQAGDKIELLVEDTGAGIPASQISQIQQPFFTTKPEGSGLGLAICRSILSQMRGRFQIESRMGEGTCVTVTIPAAQE